MKRLAESGAYSRLLALLLSVAVALSAAAETGRAGDALRGFDAEVAAALDAFKIPGAAIGVVEDGRILLAKGYGVREAGGAAKVDADTIFPIASMSKSFTTAVMASQVDEGKLDWDRPAREYLPWFRMYDPVATELVTPRDMAAHRSGLARHDFIRTSTYLDRAELVKRIRHLPPGHTFREGFQYNNLMYVVAGYLSGVIAQSSWERLVHERIFLPLGMERSSTSIQALVTQANRAGAHTVDADGHWRVMDYYDYQKFGIGPNGAVNSSVSDMLKYLQMYLDDGKSRSGRQVLSARQVEELLRPIVINEIGTPEMASYALGWFVGQRNQVPIMSHGGSIDGFTSHMAILPARDIGIVVLGNRGSTFPSMMALRLVDRLMGVADSGFAAALARRTAPRPPDEGETESKPVRAAAAPPSHALSDYSGTWSHPAYGDIRIEPIDGRLTVRFDARVFVLTHHHYDTFRMDFSSEYGEDHRLITFRLDENGDVVEALLPLEPSIAPIVFAKRG